MPRAMSSAMLAAIAAAEFQPALLVTATFRTGPIYVWTGFGSLTWNGQTWQGIGSLGGISIIEEASSVEAKSVTLSLSGVDPVLLADVMTEFLINAPVTIYFGIFSGGALITAPITMWAGHMGQPTIDVDSQTATISIACENRLVDMANASDRRYTNDDQQLDWPGDQGFQFVNAIQEITLYWGETPLSPNNR